MKYHIIKWKTGIIDLCITLIFIYFIYNTYQRSWAFVIYRLAKALIFFGWGFLFFLKWI